MRKEKSPAGGNRQAALQNSSIPSLTRTEASATTRPSALDIQPGNIPEALRNINRWVLWKFDFRDGKWTKVPFQKAGNKASSTGPGTWASFDSVLATYDTGGYDGIGFVVTDEDDIVGIDLDHCRDPETGVIETWALEIVTMLDTYTEVTPSATGIRAFVRAKFRSSANRKGQVEIYSTGRYFTLTGNLLAGTKPSPIQTRQLELDTIVTKYLGNANKSTTTPQDATWGDTSECDYPLWLRAQVRARQRMDQRFNRLYCGHWEANYPSQSEADLALTGKLLTITDGDRKLVDVAFRESGLYREKWDRRDYRDRTLDRAEHHVEHHEDDQLQAEEWPEPLPLTDIQPEMMRADLLPGDLGNYIGALAEWSETPPELPTLTVMGVLSTAVAGKMTVSPEPGYSEPSSLYLCPAMESGNRKSAVVTGATDPLMNWEQRQRETEAPLIERMSSRRKTQVAVIERMRKTVKPDDHVTPETIADLEAKLPKVPAATQLFTSDTTSERLEMMLAEQDGRAAIISDEGGLFDVLAGRYNAALNLDVYLKGHAGTSVRVQRVGRDTVIVDDPALTIMVSPQPGCLAELRDKAPLRHRGLLARFLYALPPSPIGNRKLQPAPMPSDIVLAYGNIVKSLLDWKPPKRVTLSLTEEAYAAWKEFQRYIEDEMRDGGCLSHLHDWGSKLPGAALRVAGILHAATTDDLSVLSAEIGLPTMQVAVEFCTTLISHNVAVFGLISEDPDTTSAKRLWRWLKSQGKTEVSKRDCFRAHQPHVFDRVEMMEAPLSILESHHLIRVVRHPTKGRPTGMIEIHPAALEADKSPGPS